MEPNLLVSYDSEGGYMSGKGEVHAILERIGDQKSEQTLLVPGIIGVTTSLNSRTVIEEVKEMYLADPASLNFAVQWVPSDFWCDGTLDAIKKTVKEEIKDMITPDDQYRIDVINHKSDLKEEQIVESVSQMLRGKINPDHPQKIIRIELFGEKASVTLLQQKDVFSIIKE